MTNGGEIGGCGGGSLEHPRQWLGAQWAAPSTPGSAATAQGRQARPEKEGEQGRWQGGTLTMLWHSHSIHMPFSNRKVT